MTQSSLISVLWLTLLMASCGPPEDGRALLDRAYLAHGAGALAQASMSFEFRGDQYVATRDRGLYSYERIYEDSTRTIRDYFTNDGIFRQIDGQTQQIDDRTAARILGRVNSVVYFASLPYPLKDAAVRTQYLGEAEVEGEPYQKVEVTFVQEGGGPDYQDRFVYWIHRRTHIIDYLAYYYLTNDTGSRFRRLVNPRTVGGFRFVDHENYAAVPDTIGWHVDRFDELLKIGAVEIVSEVKHENVRLVPVE